jgi:S1-C subfamily serine protease
MPHLPDARKETPVSEAPRRARGFLRTLGALVLVAVLASAATLGVDRALSDGRDGKTEAAPAPAPATSTTVTSGTTAAASASAAAVDVAKLYERVSPGVVEIRSRSGRGGSSSDDETQTAGSGFVFDERGHVVTNAHVVGDGRSFTVRFSDGSETTGTLVGADQGTDIAVLRVEVAEPGSVQPLELRTTAVRPGETAVAIGSPLGFGASVSAGIVSGVGRTIPAPDGSGIPGSIQTDAALNRGNSGGPLLDAEGRVIGVNTQLRSPGIGFAVGIETARSAAEQLIETGRVEHALLGVRIQTASPSAARELGIAAGPQVVEVQPGTPAAEAGLRAGRSSRTIDGQELTTDGDVIVAIDGETVATAEELQAAISRRKPGDRVTLAVVRGDERRTVEVTLAARPS